ncbi:hypothetical protein [Shewanella nanhaiensis]|uniref:Uncharacterized protein n=1 Tax=Shewanella nanhaiensis TaxID=2864872 RepID=A0ABS7EBD8_9GAMM|nr:hypothetical protein [Shewanella nanhaiensis]MBW8186496.1 hypothetical protein [Shewanella nanhaiensis]
MTLANECPDEHSPRYKGKSDFSLERKLTLGTGNKVKITEWFLGRPNREANQKRPSFQCQPKLLFTELLVKCNKPNRCASIAGLYQSFSDNFHKYQTFIHDFPSFNYQAKDNYCPFFGCQLEDSSEENFYLSSMLDDWKSNSKIFTQAVKDNRLSNKAAKIYIRIIGADQLELNIQLILDHVSEQWLIANILEVKRFSDFVLGGDNRGIKTQSVNFIGVEKELFYKNEYWWNLHDLGMGLDCNTNMADVQTLSPFGQNVSLVANYNQCRINTTSICY